MTTRADLIRAICAAPEDTALRLICADWLEEQGECGRAEFIRCQVRLSQTECSPCCTSQRCVCERHEWHRQEQYLLYRNRLLLVQPFTPTDWIGLSIHQDWPVIEVHPKTDPTKTIKLEFHRGFVEEITCTWEVWAEHHANLTSQQPVQKVTLTTCPEGLESTSERGQRTGRDLCLLLLTKRWPHITFELPPPNWWDAYYELPAPALPARAKV